MGYEIGRAIENKKKILCLFRPDSGKCKLMVSFFKNFCIIINHIVRDVTFVCFLLVLSAMIRGAIDDNLVVKDYKEEDIPHILEEFFKSL